MKIVEKFRQIGKQSGNRRGVALVTVLTVMSLATILILTFFSLAQSEHRASSIYSNGLQAQQVAEQAVNMVIAQIRKASSSNNVWASQPGALRTWNKSGDFEMGYKLYSDDEMVINDEVRLVTTDFDEMAQSWDSNPDLYVDLNEPVIRGTKIYYPIVVPEARDIPAWPKKIGNDDQGVEGFDYNTGDGGASNEDLPKLLTQNLTDAGELRKAVKEAANKETLPMPVRWIYQLEDGTMGFLGGSNKFQVLSGSGQPSEDNRIAARFAFWADDETSKLNVNVHAGGLAWDIPKAGGDLDMALGKFQPAQHEWQRYPGHPATTHLIPVLAPGVVDIVNDRDAMNKIFDLIPRIVGGGSESGTRKIDPRNVEERNGLVADKDRLFPSVDEFILRPNRELAEFPDPKGNALKPSEIPDHLERSKFFLTVNSRAPETTLFNTPRVAMWPIYNAKRDGSSTSDYQRRLTHFDRLIHFCSTLGGSDDDRYDYIFRRENADSATFDYSNIERNKRLYEYLDALMGEDFPGYGGSFHSKYGVAQSSQILTEIFDYIRCTNLYDDSLFGEDYSKSFVKNNTSDHLTYTNPRGDRKGRDVIGEDLLHKGYGQVTPIKITNGSVETMGFGRFYTLSDIAIHVICCADAGEIDPKLPSPLLHNKLVGGVGALRYAGAVDYKGNVVSKGAETGDVTYSNFPPLHAQVNLNYNLLDESQKAVERNTKWPQWLKDHWQRNENLPPGIEKDPLIYQSGENLGGVFDQSCWNWQLGWLWGTADPEDSYTNEIMLQDERRGKIPAGDEMRLRPGEKLVQGAMYFTLFSPSLGWVPINPDMSIDIRVGQDIGFVPHITEPYRGGDGKFLAGSTTKTWDTNRRQVAWGDRHYGGTRSISYQITAEPGKRGRWVPGLDPIHPDEAPFAAANYNQYPWVTKPFVIFDNKLEFNGGNIEFNIRDGGNGQDSATQDGNSETIQNIIVYVDSFISRGPILSAGRRGLLNEFNEKERYPVNPMADWSLSRHGVNPVETSKTGRYDNNWMSGRNPHNHGRLWYIDSHEGLGQIFRQGDVVRAVGIMSGDPRIAATRPEIGSGEIYGPHWKYDDEDLLTAHSIGHSTGANEVGRIIDRNRQLVADVNYNGANPVTIIGKAYNTANMMKYGDFDNGPGLTADGAYINKPDEGNTHSLFNRTDPDRAGSGSWEMRRDYGDFPYFVRDWIHEPGSPSYFSPNRIVNGPGMFGSLPTGTMSDAPWQTLLFRPNTVGAGYQSHPGAASPPDHLIMDLFWMPVVEPYAISEPLSTGGKVNLNYQMLPFRHIERSTALRGVFKSEFMLCVPTLGTGASRSKYTLDYKRGAGRGRGYHWRDKPFGGELQGKRLRTVILEDETLSQFYRKFETDYKIFKTASEITTIHLVPQQVAERQGSNSNRARITTYTPDVKNGEVADMDSGKYWQDHAVVGDNSRERPYGNIYSRVTTKSNTFKVFYRAQVLKQSRRAKGGDWSWDSTIDSVVGEYRGSTIVERYIEPNNPRIPDYATKQPTQVTSLGEFYKFRIVNPTRFAP